VKHVITSRTGPQAIGPYSQAIRGNGLVFVSGQLALDPSTGQLIDGDSARQTERIMENCVGLLEAAGSSLSKVVKTTLYLKDLNDFLVVNAVYAKFFTTDPPARATVQVSRLPKDARIEIDMIALE
jgi:2-iminobutanoate/2-iminopropanoate deaminase